MQAAKTFRATLISIAFLAATAALTTGCGLGPQLASSSAAPIGLKGRVHGGQQPIAGADIYLYQVGAAGNGSAATNLLTSPVQTAADGSFGITGDYTCPDANAPVYIVSSGGDPGTGTANPAAVMVAALGTCGNLLANGADTFVSLDEITTVAAAWALGGFATGPANIGASSTNALGISRAFFNTTLLADTSTGGLAVNSATGGTTHLVENAKLISLANTLAACVNSTSAGPVCTALFTAATPASGNVPSDVFTAALNIVHNPGANVADIYNLAPPTPPFGDGLSTAPNDWTLSSSTYPPPGSCFSGLAIDATGTLWLPDACGNLLHAYAQGQPISGSPFGAGTINFPSSVIANTNGDIWLANLETGASPLPSPNGQLGYLLRFQGSSSSTPGALYYQSASPFVFDSTTATPQYLAARANGNFLITNTTGTQSVTEYDANGAVVSATNGPAPLVQAVPDANGGFWYLYANSNLSGAEHFVAGDYTNPITPACCSAVPYAGTSDANGTMWGINGSTVSAVDNSNTTVLDSQTVAGLYGAISLAIDAGGVAWPLSNAPASGIGPVTFAAVSTGSASGGPGNATAGTVLSPATGLGLDANLQNPRAIAPDASGNLWVVDAAGGLVQFFGLATPTATPLLPTPTAP